MCALNPVSGCRPFRTMSTTSAAMQPASPKHQHLHRRGPRVAVAIHDGRDACAGRVEAQRFGPDEVSNDWWLRHTGEIVDSPPHHGGRLGVSQEHRRGTGAVDRELSRCRRAVRSRSSNARPRRECARHPAIRSDRRCAWAPAVAARSSSPDRRTAGCHQASNPDPNRFLNAMCVLVRRERRAFNVFGDHAERALRRHRPRRAESGRRSRASRRCDWDRG